MTRMWRIAKEAVLLELAIWQMLARWVARRPDVPEGATAIGYGRLAEPVMWLWVFGSFSEVVALELILRSLDAGWAHALRVPLLIVGVWGALWMLGLMGSLRVRRHLVFDDRIQVRYGPRHRVDVPMDAIAGCRAVEHDLEGMARVVQHEDGLLLIGVSSRTNVELVLSEPTVLATHTGERTADRVGFWVDEPRDFVRLLESMDVARA